MPCDLDTFCMPCSAMTHRISLCHLCARLVQTLNLSTTNSSTAILIKQVMLFITTLYTILIVKLPSIF